MGVVLAIDPGRRQGKTLDRLTQEFADHEVVIATSGDEALVVLDGVVPDLVLFPLFIAQSDESRLQGRLRGLANPADHQALTIPLRTFFDWEGQANRPTAVPPRWYYWFKPAAGLSPDLQTPQAFAEAVRRDVNRPRATVTATRGATAPLSGPLSAPSPSPLPSPAPAWSAPAAAAPELSPAFASALTATTFDAARTATSAPAAVAPSASAYAVPMPSDYTSPAPGYAAPAGPAPAFTPAYAPVAPQVATTSTLSNGPSPIEFHETVEVDEPEEYREPAEPRPSVFAKVGPLLSSLWERVTDLPRPVQVGAPVMAILLTLGATGHVRPLLSAPGRLLGSAKTNLFPEKPKTGVAEIQTVPDGAQVWFDGRQLGVTPMRSEFAAGTHEVEVRYKNTTRTVMLEVTAGETIVQRIEWAAPKTLGKLRVESDPSGAAVMIDGKPRGNTPLSLDDVPTGKHTVDVMLSGNMVHETVDVKGTKPTVLRTSIYQGWLALFSPIDVKLAADGRPLSLDDQGRVMLPSGTHKLTLQNRALGYTETRTIDIKPGDTTAVNVTLPKTTLTVTTSSPAEVWVDGEKVGDAPITDLAVEIGTRDVLVRSPEHGERHATITATMNPARVAIDFAASAP